LLIGIAGVGINVAPLGSELEENFGLDLLFTLRGVRQAPADVVIVSIDKESADELGLPDDPRKWPRSSMQIRQKIGLPIALRLLPLMSISLRNIPGRR
jgi:CHASE2 domain-containing sensor protein